MSGALLAAPGCAVKDNLVGISKCVAGPSPAGMLYEAYIVQHGADKTDALKCFRQH